MSKKINPLQDFVSFQFAKLLAATSFFSPQELLSPCAQLALMEQKGKQSLHGGRVLGAGRSLAGCSTFRLQQPGQPALAKPDRATRERLAALPPVQAVARPAKVRHVKRQAGAPFKRG